MKITAQEEYGVRLLLQIANHGNNEGMSIPQLSEAEGLSTHYVAKLCRLLRISGFIKSSRGKDGGYTLARDGSQISINQVLTSLGGKLYSAAFCQNHSGTLTDCCHGDSCSVRPLWQLIQHSVDQVLDQFSLQDLMDTDNRIQKASAQKPAASNRAMTLKVNSID